MSDNGFEGNASRIYPRIVQPAPGATSDRDKLCQIISEAVGGWNQNTQAITRVADAILAAGFGLVADAKAPEVRYVDLTTGEKDVLDEVVAFNAYVHLEAMDSNHWWMAITSGGKTVHVNLYTKRAKITAHADEEDS